MSQIEVWLAAIVVVLFCMWLSRERSEKQRERADQDRHRELLAVLEPIRDRLS